MNPELHLFIIWEKAQEKRNVILEDLKTHFQVLYIYEITWSKETFAQNLSRFYGQKLARNSGKERHCGTGPFTLIIVRDQAPHYEETQTSSGLETVNTNIFTAKTKYRSWTGGGHKIHATNSRLEFQHDLMLLLGFTPSEFVLYIADKESNLEVLNCDLQGAEGWNDLAHLFRVLNACSEYVVLRNFQGLPHAHSTELHGDIDLLVEDLVECVLLVNAKKVFRPQYRVHYVVKVKGKATFFDFRYLTDHYYDLQWQKDILEHKILLNTGVYVPNEEHYFYSLLYHAKVHKFELSSDYVEILNTRALEELPNLAHFDVQKEESRIVLDAFMSQHGYQYCEPKDLSVLFNDSFCNMTPSLPRRVGMSLLKFKQLVKKQMQIA